MDGSGFLFLALIGVYFLAFVLFAAEFKDVPIRRLPGPARFVELGFLIHTLLIFAHVFIGSRSGVVQFLLPVTTLGEASGFFAWSLAFVYLILLREFRTETFGLILVPILILFLIPTLYPFQANPALAQYVNDHYFLLHIFSAFFAYASFALSFIAAALYLVLDRALKRKTQSNFYFKFPSLDELEQLIFRTILWGVILLGSAIMVGALWTRSVFGTYFLLEPKSIGTLLILAVYLVIMYLHKVALIKGRRVIRMSLAAFLLVLVNFLGTSFLGIGLHAGAW